MVVRMRHTRSHTRNRRAHHSLIQKRFSTCVQCGTKHIRHRACLSCGTYRGKQIIDVVKKAQKKEKKAREKEKNP